MNLRIWPAAAVLLVLASCSQGTEGIFASIEREQKIKSAGGMSKVATVTHMAELNGRYYSAGGGALFQRASNEVKWHASFVSSLKNYKHVVSVGRVGPASPTGGTLYAIANLDNTDTNDLFSSTDGSNWFPVTVPGGNRAFSLVPIHNPDGFTSDQLVLTVTPTTAATYQTVYILDSTGFKYTVDLGFAYGFPVTGAAYEGSGVNYYLVNNDRVFYYNGTVAPVTGSDLGIDHGFSDVILLPTAGFPNWGANPAVVSSTKATLYWGSLNGGTWTQTSSVTGREDDNGSRVIFGSMLYQDQNAEKFLWITTLNTSSGSTSTNQGAGIASLSNATAADFQIQPPSGTDKDNFNSSFLSAAQVWSLTRTSNGYYYAGTAAQGLWNWNPSTISWSQE